MATKNPEKKKQTEAQRIAAKKKAFLVAFEKKVGNVTQACKAVQISRQTYYNWIDDDDEFCNRVLEVRDSLVDFAEGTLLSLIQEKHPTATIFFLKTQGKHRGYSE